MKVLVTGANGFVGTAVVNAAAAAGWQVRAAVRDMSAPRPAQAHECVAAHLERDDWSEPLRGVDAVIHLAARVHVMRERAVDPLSAFRAVNVTATRRLAQAAADTGVRRFVFVSSVKVHGEERDAPYRESDEPAPRDAYGQSKLEAELALRDVAEATGLSVTVVRPPLVYGPGVKANFRAMIDAVHRGIPLPLAGVRNRRSTVYVVNLADALVRCASDERSAGKTYLVSDGEPLSTPELLGAIGEALGKRPRLFPAPPGALALARRIPRVGAAVRRLTGSLAVDASLIQTELGWRAPVAQQDALAATARWFLDQNRRE